MERDGILTNFIAGEWRAASTKSFSDVMNPANSQKLVRVPLSPAAEVDAAAKAAVAAHHDWRRTPATERVQVLFRLKALLEENFEDVCRTITKECGKTLVEARGELRRGVENVEVACGIPAMMQGYNSEDIARGIDEFMLRQPVGVVAVICPFNFPAMIPLWFLPYAIACGNTVVLKPSERTPMTMQKIVGLFEKAGLPKGVVQVVHGSKEAVDAILDHKAISAVSFVGSTNTAKYVYSRAAAAGKRALCQGGAKNPVVVLPDADMETTTRILADSAFGCAGQRCLAASLAVTVGDARKTFTDAIVEAAKARKVGNGLDEGIEMGPVISAESKARIEGMIASGLKQGAKAVVDGRGAEVKGGEKGHFLKPTVLADVQPDTEIASTEIFGPVLSLMHAKDIDEAIAFINRGRYGNMACLFTTSGHAARRFRYEVEAGNIGINVGVAAPMAFFPFSGWKESFFGDMHAQGWDAIEFYTQKKVVVEQWKGWSRKF